MISDFLDAMSRNYAGRLSDGRYYPRNNANYMLHNRTHLTLLIGEDSYFFDEVYILVDGPTDDQCVRGLLKQQCYMYPYCLTYNDRLLVGYSINKEDIEPSGIVDAAGL